MSDVYFSNSISYEIIILPPANLSEKVFRVINWLFTLAFKTCLMALVCKGSFSEFSEIANQNGVINVFLPKIFIKIHFLNIIKLKLRSVLNIELDPRLHLLSIKPQLWQFNSSDTISFITGNKIITSLVL